MNSVHSLVNQLINPKFVMSKVKEILLDGINSFYSYLQTVGYKVAHYYGYLLADQLLPHLVPGYYADSAYVSTYGLILNKDIGVNVFNLK